MTVNNASFGSRRRAEWLYGGALALPILVWPFVVRPGLAFLAVTILLVIIPLFAAQTAAQLIMVLFAYYGVDGYLRLVFEYGWPIYVLPLVATALVYVRWFFGPQWKRSHDAFHSNPISLPLMGLSALFGLQTLNGVPWSPLVSAGGLVYHLGAAPLFFLAASGFADERQIRRILWFIVSLACFECVYALGQYYFGPAGPLALSQHYQARIAGEAWWTPAGSGLVYRPTGLTLGGGGPGMYGFIGVVLALGLFDSCRPALWRRIAALVAVFLMLLAVFLSAVRAFWAGLLVALVAFGLLQGVRYLTVLAGLSWAAAAVVIGWTRGALYERLATLAAPWEVFSRQRGVDIVQLPDIVAQYPMGIGIGRVAGSAAGQARELLPQGLYGGSHNYWVSVTWEASILAPVLLGWLLWRLARSGLSVLRRTRERGSQGVVAAILALDAGIVTMTASGPALAGVASSFAQFFWFLSGLLFAFVSASAHHPESSSADEGRLAPDVP